LPTAAVLELRNVMHVKPFDRKVDFNQRGMGLRKVAYNLIVVDDPAESPRIKAWPASSWQLSRSTPSMKLVPDTSWNR
jgi:hypothetical protein